METEFPEVFALDDGRKKELIYALWDSMGDQSESPPSSEEFYAELDRRHAEFLKDPSRAIPWEQAIAELEARRAERQHV